MISAVVLAAGLSSRMGGRPKALLPIGTDEVFVTRIVRTLRDGGIDDVVVVVGHQADAVRKAIEDGGLQIRIVENGRYREGQLSSIVAGLQAVARPGLEAVLLALVDAPLFAASTVRAVVERFERSHAPVVRAVRGAEHGHPVLIRADLLDEIRAADPSSGAKPVIRAHVSEMGDVPVEDSGAFIDIDTPEDYARFLGGDADTWQPFGKR
jgi:molybdenum cofactor cytidylyltransferase